MKAQNEKEFKQLIKKYESLTEEMLLEENEEPDLMAELLSRITGFGTFFCSLCGAIREQGVPLDCNKCVYGSMLPKCDNLHACLLDNNSDSYDAILAANSIESLLLAIQSRAKHMKEVYKQYLKQRS